MRVVNLLGSVAMTCDLNGNTLNDGTNAYAWDARNRMVSADSNSASFTYDPLGRRMSKTFLSATTDFLYDGANPVQEQNGSAVTANLLTGGIDERFQRTDSTGSYSYLTDALGSTMELTDSTGAQQTTYSYGPYGAISISGTTNNTYTYTGREVDDLGLYYYRARYYNPQAGRFISDDPAGFAGSGPDLYAYAGDDPMDFNDPFGLDKNPCSGTKTGSTLHGVLDLGLGVAKISLGILAAPETGGLSLYGAYSGLSNLVSSGAELYGGYSGNLAGSERVANYSTAAGSISGIVTLAITGNAKYGANASTIEGLATVGVTGGLVSTGTMEAPGLADNAVTLFDNGVGAAGLVGNGGCPD